jgi:hypothetical protein
MTPIATALDILQGDKNMYMGALLPTVRWVIRELELLQKEQFTYCRTLVAACIAGVKKRFEEALNDKTIILAAASHPEYKLGWLTKNDDPSKGQVEKILRAEFRRMSRELPQVEAEKSTPTHGKSFLLVDDSDEEDNAETECEITKFLSPHCKQIDDLYNLPVIMQIFKKYNTPLPASGSVERLFSIAGDICTRKRGKMSDDTFESTLFNKLNITKTISTISPVP